MDINLAWITMSKVVIDTMLSYKLERGVWDRVQRNPENLETFKEVFYHEKRSRQLRNIKIDFIIKTDTYSYQLPWRLWREIKVILLSIWGKRYRNLRQANWR